MQAVLRSLAVGCEARVSLEGGRLQTPPTGGSPQAPFTLTSCAPGTTPSRARSFPAPQSPFRFSPVALRASHTVDRDTGGLERQRPGHRRFFPLLADQAGQREFSNANISMRLLFPTVVNEFSEAFTQAFSLIEPKAHALAISAISRAAPLRTRSRAPHRCPGRRAHGRNVAVHAVPCRFWRRSAERAKSTHHRRS